MSLAFLTAYDCLQGGRAKTAQGDNGAAPLGIPDHQVWCQAAHHTVADLYPGCH